MYAADGRSAIIDYDKDKGRFYVKAFLAKVNDLKEIRLLWWVLFMLGFSLFMQIVLFSVSFYSTAKSREEIIKAISTQ